MHVGNQDVKVPVPLRYSDPATMQLLVDSPGFFEVMRIWYELATFIDMSDSSCSEFNPPNGLPNHYDQCALSVKSLESKTWFGSAS